MSDEGTSHDENSPTPTQDESLGRLVEFIKMQHQQKLRERDPEYTRRVSKIDQYRKQFQLEDPESRLGSQFKRAA